jgi:hypothetical protein
VADHLKQIIISKEDAVFWMDGQGVWQNEHGPIEHPKIIRYFNTCVKKDDQGFFVYQKTDTTEEKVYFKYEETAIFAIDLKVDGSALRIKLNTGEWIELDPATLFTRDDNLYLDTESCLIKFNTSALLKISKFIDETEDNHLTFNWNNQQVPIPEQ